ncbi:MAG: hypothetical protein ACI9HK_005187, partial [Pirellulaceae bacterium]
MRLSRGFRSLARSVKSTVTQSRSTRNRQRNRKGRRLALESMESRQLLASSIFQTAGTTAVSEAGVTDSYTIALASQPTSNVVVDLDTGVQVTTSASTLTFTPSNWSVAQSVTVTAVDDTAQEGLHSTTIAHIATSSDPSFDGQNLADVLVNIADNGDTTPGVEFAFESSTGSFVVAPGKSFDISVSYSLTAGEENITIVQLNFDGSELGTNQLTLANWSSNPGWILPLDESLSTPTDNNIAITAGFAPNSTSETEIGTFRLTAPNAIGSYRLTLNSITTPPNDTGIAGATLGSLPIVNFADVDIIVNNPPTASDDNYFIPEDAGPLSYNVLANDSTAPDAGETMSVVAVGPTSHGTATISNGSIRYTADDNYFGTESFTYTISDGNTGTDVATVTLSISSVNDTPSLGSDNFTIDEDTTNQSLDVLSNDTTFPDVGETLNITSTSGLNHGTVTIVDGTSIIYTPSPDYIGTDTFTYTITDGNGSTVTESVTVTVVDANNDAPTAVADSETVDEDTTNNTIDVLANDTFSPDLGETLTITAASTPANGVVNIVGGTSVTYSPTADFAGQDTFTYTITDGRGASATATVTVTVNDSNNDAPTAVADSKTVDEDTTNNTIDVLANDTFSPDLGETLTITAASTPANGVVNIVGGTSVTYSPTADFAGQDTFT